MGGEMGGASGEGRGCRWGGARAGGRARAVGQRPCGGSASARPTRLATAPQQRRAGAPSAAAAAGAG